MGEEEIEIVSPANPMIPVTRSFIHARFDRERFALNKSLSSVFRGQFSEINLWLRQAGQKLFRAQCRLCKIIGEIAEGLA
jgi:hypothetical protein